MRGQWLRPRQADSPFLPDFHRGPHQPAQWPVAPALPGVHLPAAPPRLAVLPRGGLAGAESGLHWCFHASGFMPTTLPGGMSQRRGPLLGK